MRNNQVILTLNLLKNEEGYDLFSRLGCLHLSFTICMFVSLAFSIIWGTAFQYPVYLLQCISLVWHGWLLVSVVSLILIFPSTFDAVNLEQLVD